MTHTSAFSPHSAEVLSFLSDVVKMDSKWLNVLKDCLPFQFTSIPGRYFEANNRSALENLDFVRTCVAGWLVDGHIEQLAQPAWCTNPLIVVQKYDPVKEKLKES